MGIAAVTASKQHTQDLLDQQIQSNSSLQSRLDTAQEAAQQAQQQVQQLQQSHAQLVQQAAKQAAEAEQLQGELAGLRQREMQLREQVAVQQEQVGVCCGLLHNAVAGVSLAVRAKPEAAGRIAYGLRNCP
jgi:septal ring factor EnvC (AmiA/AmiB activator)